MKIAIHQPQYLPWIGYFDKMDRADIFVILDDVQYKKNEWQNRNKIRTSESWQWLTVPVHYKFGELIKDVEIDDHKNWPDKHLKSIEMNYAKSEHFDKYILFFRDIFSGKWGSLEELNTHCIRYIKDSLGIKTKILRSSMLGVASSSTERLVGICRSLDADTYISGIGGRDYLDENLFSESNIKVEYQDYKHPEYEQLHEGFFPYMSAVDLLFCCAEESLDIIRSGR